MKQRDHLHETSLELTVSKGFLRVSYNSFENDRAQLTADASKVHNGDHATVPRRMRVIGAIGVILRLWHFASDVCFALSTIIYADVRVSHDADHSAGRDCVSCRHADGAIVGA
jgi:hypothetical protein